uniref:Uncharacterized protein n=1 Tax=Anopheles maculatus TaxID=74869 RepID=A0A182SA68_9DIPT
NRAGPSNLGNVISQILLCKQITPDFNQEELCSITKDSQEIARILQELQEFMPQQESYLGFRRPIPRTATATSRSGDSVPRTITTKLANAGSHFDKNPPTYGISSSLHHSQLPSIDGSANPQLHHSVEITAPPETKYR